MDSLFWPGFVSGFITCTVIVVVAYVTAWANSRCADGRADDEQGELDFGCDVRTGALK